MNKERALRTLRAKLYQQIIEKQLSQEHSARKLQVRTCDQLLKFGEGAVL